MKQLGVFVLFIFLSLGACKDNDAPKIKGVSFVASGDSVQQGHLDSLLPIQANYAAVMPFAFIRNPKQPEVRFNFERQWFGETVEGASQYIQQLKKHDIAVMMKPQIWISHGEYTGDLEAQTEADWQLLETTYRDFIMTFAYVAEEQKVPLFCIGTELEKFVAQRPQFWKALIAEIRTIYSGKLTYAANWDEYKHTDIWKSLDYVGVDAYFPISEERTPTVEASKTGWQPWIEEMHGVSKNFQKPILFTEYGYRSVDYAGKEPWHSSREMKGVNLRAQENLLLGLFESVWQEEWFAGGFLWKWHMHHERVGGLDNTMFTPQRKPAQQVVAKKYQLP